MLNTDILDELFRVQATLEHVLVAGRVEELEKLFLRRALKIQGEAVKAVALLSMKGNPL